MRLLPCLPGSKPFTPCENLRSGLEKRLYWLSLYSVKTFTGSSITLIFLGGNLGFPLTLIQPLALRRCSPSSEFSAEANEPKRSNFSTDVKERYCYCPARRLFISRSLSRFFISSRLSYNFFGFASASSTFAMPFLK